MLQHSEAGLDSSQRNAMLLYGLDLLDQGVTVFDAQLRLLACNQRFLDLLEFPAELGQVGTPFADYIRYNAYRGEYGPGDPEQQVAERVALAMRFEPHDTERIRPDGSVLRVRGEPLPSGGFIALYTDKTQQQAYERLQQQQKADLESHVRARTAELEAANQRLREAHAANVQITAALQRSEERLRLITDTIPALIAYFDKDHVYRYANKGYSDWFGRRNEHIVGQRIEAALGSKFYAAVVSYVNEALTGKQVTYEYSMEKDDGTHIFARSTLVPEIAPDGEVLGCFVLSFDITEQKQTQSALVQAQKMEAVGQLSGGLAHDFNNMLTVVIGNLAELRRHEEHNTALLGYLDPALQAAERGVALVRRLLTFARQQPLLPSAVDIGALLQDMLQLIRRSLPESIALQSQLLPVPLFAMADPHQLESAILNLVLNARDAMADGGSLQLSASLAQLGEREAAEWQLQAGDYVCIEVADTGCGMSPELLLRVFEPFFTTKRFGSGSGLGLAMVYSFARQSGGAVHVSSTPGKGTRFTLRLPHTQPAAQPAGRLNFSGKAGGRERPLTLLVEDNADVRRVVRLQLTSLGYPVLEAESGDEAAAMLENIPDIGLLLSDIVMPGTLDGRALAQLARSLLPRIRVVLMSGYDDSGHHVSGGLPKLEKPFTPAELAALLDEVMLCPPQA